MLEIIKNPNFILACDSYKVYHYAQLPQSTEKAYSVIVPRKPNKKFMTDNIVAMGQTFVSAALANIRITQDMIEEAAIEITEQGYEFNREGWELIEREYGGKLPLAVYGVEEGSIVKPQTPVLGIINTDKHSAWLPAYVETWVQSAIWYMSTVASLCRVARLTIKEFMELTGADMSMLDYKFHLFGDRAATSRESAILAGMSHGALFSGSDCLEANSYIKKLYGTSKVYLSSVVASEHSTMCANSDAANKDDFGAALMTVQSLYDAVERSKRGIGIPLVSAVIDTYDSERYVKEYIGVRLKDKIVASGGKYVARPDSGVITVEPVKISRLLMDAFGYNVNEKGYSVVTPCVGTLQGDGVNIETIRPILQAFVDDGQSIDNIVLGSGHGVTQDVARDDFSFSMKSIAIYNGSHWVRLKKDPITDPGKKSLSGLVRCIRVNDEIEVYDALDNGSEYSFFQETDGWRLYSADGYRKYRPTYDEVRFRARK